ncbi:MAG: hypothetical protein J6W64_08675 [Bacilli bacterium]|nr:hypothetical protein [Bacilli bacterium]
MKEVLTFDLDNTIFDTTPVTREAFRRCHKPFYYGTFFNVHKSYPKDVADTLTALFSDDIWFHTNLLNEEVPYLINQLNNLYDVYYVSNRYRQNKDSYDQLVRNGINCVLDQVVITSGSKTNTLKDLNTMLHFDDSPHVIEDCLQTKIPCHMISNHEMQYNYYLRDKVKYSKDLKEAIEMEKLLERVRC